MLFRPSGVSSSKSSCTRFSNGASFFAVIVCPSARSSSAALSFVVRRLGAPAGRRRRRRRRCGVPRRVRSSDRIDERAARETSFGCYVLRDACVRPRSCRRGDAASRRTARPTTPSLASRTFVRAGRARAKHRFVVEFGPPSAWSSAACACSASRATWRLRVVVRLRARARARARNTVSVPSSVRFYAGR